MGGAGGAGARRRTGVTLPVDEHAAAVAAPVRAALDDCDLADLAARATEGVRERGVEMGGPHGAAPLRLDPVPRVVAGDEWDRLADGLVQQLRALEAFLRDPSLAVREGVVPAEVVETCLYREPGPAPSPVAVGVYGPDVVRDAAGELVVLEDNLRTPTLMGYAEAAREVVGGLLPGTPRPLGGVAPALAGLLRAAAPDVDDPVVAVLGDRRGSGVRWEPERFARALGVPLVDLDDLTARGDRLRLPNGRPVDVLWRRTSEERLLDDAGALNAYGQALLPGLASGRLRVVNPYGTGLADDKRVHARVDDLVRLHLGEEPRLRSVPTWDAADVLDRLDELVLKPRTGSGGWGVTVMPHADAAARAAARAAVLTRPSDWVAQEPVALSTVPVVVGGRLEPRHVDLRPCVLSDGAGATVLAGGATRFASAAGGLVVNAAQGGGLKDTWVLD